MKINYLRNAVILLFLGICSSCTDSENNVGEIINPVLPNDDLMAFFEKHLPHVSSGYSSDCFFTDTRENKYIVINSMDELRKNISDVAIETPVIDFKSYTLIIGQYEVPSSSYYVIKHDIAVGTKKYDLNVLAFKPESSYAVVSALYYWGLYSKFPQKSINVNITFQTK